MDDSEIIAARENGANVRRGDIRNSEYAWKAKTYSWGAICDLFPRGISPTDVDGAIEINGRYLLFEMKTYDTVVPVGQRMFLERWMYGFRPRGCVMVCSHPPLESVDVPTNLEAMSVWYWDSSECAIGKTSSFKVTEEKLAWLLREWIQHAEERPNSFMRGCMEMLGTLPTSRDGKFTRIGGKLCYPPYDMVENVKTVER